MNLRTAVSSVLDSTYEFRSKEVKIKLDSGETVIGTLDYESCKMIVRAIANRLIHADASERESAAYEQSRRIRAALIAEFDMKGLDD